MIERRHLHDCYQQVHKCYQQAACRKPVRELQQRRLRSQAAWKISGTLTRKLPVARAARWRESESARSDSAFGCKHAQGHWYCGVHWHLAFNRSTSRPWGLCLVNSFQRGQTQLVIAPSSRRVKRRAINLTTRTTPARCTHRAKEKTDSHTETAERYCPSVKFSLQMHEWREREQEGLAAAPH